MQAAVKLRRHHLRWLAVLLLIVATFTLQAVPLAHDSAGHLADGCVFCHFAHMAWANPAPTLGVLAPVVSEWHITVHKSSGYAETLVVIGHSRAPPA